jgi:hypothetical protein
VLAVVRGLGLIGEQTYPLLVGLLTGGGFMALRAGVKTDTHG